MQYTPYAEDSLNQLYNMLFCDDPGLFRSDKDKKPEYPFSVLTAESPDRNSLEVILQDAAQDPRAKLLASHILRQQGLMPEKRELLGVIVELGLDQGLDVLASFNNGTARYFNQVGKLVIWETTDHDSMQLTRELFSYSADIAGRIGPWDKERLPPPVKGNLRLSFLVTDGLYFGEGPISVLFNDQMAAPALNAATNLMQYIIQPVSAKSKK